MTTETTEIVFTDRYGPAGPPSQLAGCRGPCEAMGWVPVYLAEGDARPELRRWRSEREIDPVLRHRWHIAHEASDHADEDPPGVCDGTHFVRCPDCEGRGTLPWHRRWRNVPHVIERKWSFARGHLLRAPYGRRTADLASLACMELDETGRPLRLDPPDVAAAARRTWADRTDVRWSWAWNRRVALQVLTGTTSHQRAQRGYRWRRRRVRVARAWERIRDRVAAR